MKIELNRAGAASEKPWKLEISGWAERTEFSLEIRSLCGKTGLVRMVESGVFKMACENGNRRNGAILKEKN